MSGIFRPTTGGGGGSGGDLDTLVRDYTVGVVVYDVVYQKPDGSVDKADASSQSTMPTIGIVKAIDNPAPGKCMVQYGGDLFGFSGLTAGRIYIVSKDPGKLIWEGDVFNSFFPGAPGNISQQVGVAGSANLLKIEIQDQIEV